MTPIAVGFYEWVLDHVQELRRMGKVRAIKAAFKAGAVWQREKNAIDSANDFYQKFGFQYVPPHHTADPESLGI